MTNSTEPANLIFFLSDNHNAAFLGAAGHPRIHTPTLDRIAANGVRFTNAYCGSPLCCPSRAALTTGRFPHQTGYWDNGIVYDGRVPSWMRRLRDQGHMVTSVGKLHFRRSEDDNGFTEELLPMHILDGRGGVHMMLRGYDDEPRATGQWELYTKKSHPGETHYQEFDRKITARAIQWLREHGQGQDRPWVLLVSYPSPHPAFQVPERLFDLYPPDQMPLPPQFLPGECPRHPAVEHLRAIMDTREMTDPAVLQTIAAGYCGLITHVDEQIGEVMAVAEELGLLDSTRVMYSSDHGELVGAHGLFGKSCLYEGSVDVPMLLSGPGVPRGREVDEIVSHVDLFPTILEACGVEPAPEDADLPGLSLWPAIRGERRERIGFAEYHAAGSKSGGFMLREGDLKLIYHVGMPSQLFDLAADPHETRDLVEAGTGREKAAELEGKLRNICNPEEVDRRAKLDQRCKIDFWGGKEKIMREGTLVITPPPGVEPDLQPTEAVAE